MSIKRKIALTVIFTFLFFSLIYPCANAYTSYYTSAFEGPKGQFYGVKYQPTWASAPLYYSLTQKVGSVPSPSMQDFGVTMKLDTDATYTGQPNLIGEMSAIYLPKDKPNIFESWFPSNYQDDSTKPVNTYPWEIGDYTYLMKEYWMRWYVTVNAEANTQASWLGGQTEFPAPLAPGVIGVNSYKNAEVWLEVDMSPTWYISGGGRAYFALAEVELADYALADSHKNLAGATVTRRPDCSVSPLSPSSLLAIYDAPFGGQSTTSNTPYEYLGRQLNPQYFKDKAYLKLDLNDFGVWSEMVLGIPPVTNHGDVAVWALDVKVFVIGEWLVQDVQENPDIYGRFEQVYGGYDWFDWIIPNLPWLVPLAIFLILVFFAPMVLISIINALR